MIAIIVLLILGVTQSVSYTQNGNKVVGTGYTDAINGIYQGCSSSMSADGTTLAIGACNDNSGIGATWVFVNVGGTWSQQGPKLVGTGYITGSSAITQGVYVSLSNDGNTLAVGGYGDDDYVGATWIFVRVNDTWSQQGSKLLITGATGPGPSEQGFVSLSGDGATLAIGSAADDDYIGATWIFTRSGGVWTQYGSKLIGTGYIGQSYQGVPALSGDGLTLVISGYNDDSGIGALWIFVDIAGTWTQQGPKIVADDSVGAGLFGWIVSISYDGNTVATVGIYDDTNTGATFILTRNITTLLWSQQGPKLVGQNYTPMPQQGCGMALSSDGNTVATGSCSDDGGYGALWVFTRSSEIWTEEQKLIGTGAVGSQPQQGFSVGINSDGTIVSSAGQGDDTNIGAVWIFNADIPTEVPTCMPSIQTSQPTQEGAEETAYPTIAPTCFPTSQPTGEPTSIPTAAPTNAPTASPTKTPTPAPTKAPTSAPTNVPTQAPTGTGAPTPPTTSIPTSTPTSIPTSAPTSIPTPVPTKVPTPPTSSPTATHRTVVTPIIVFSAIGVAIVGIVLSYIIAINCQDRGRKQRLSTNHHFSQL